MSNCKSDIVRKVITRFGIREVEEEDEWNLCWTDNNITVERAKRMKRFQRINHFIGMSEICSKDMLAKNLKRMQKCFPSDYNFFPKTWCLPVEFNDVVYYSKLHKNKIFILKPKTGCQGRGIMITKNLNDINKNAKLICQIYISKPYLIDGFKFDIRIYCLISSCDPLRIFIYNEGIVRFATVRYAEPNAHNCKNVFMHLTNYSINKQNNCYVHSSEFGSKRKISTLNRILKTQGVDTERLWKIIDEAIVKTVISASPILKHNYNTCFSSHDMVQACFEILGFDVLLDHNLHPYILEVNHSPSLHTDSKLDKDVKENLIIDTLNLLNVWNCDKRKMMEEDRQKIINRLNQRSGTVRNSPEFEREVFKEHDKSPWQDQIEWEEKHLGNYRKVYPGAGHYSKFFQQPSNTLFLSTASSRARDECGRQQREDMDVKLKGQYAKPNVERLIHELTYEKNNFKNRNANKRILPKIARLKQTYDPSRPAPIVESEERHRLAAFEQRRRLIINRGVLEVVFQILKTIGTVTTSDEVKYSQLLRHPKTITETFESLSANR